MGFCTSMHSLFNYILRLYFFGILFVYNYITIDYKALFNPLDTLLHWKATVLISYHLQAIFRLLLCTKTNTMRHKLPTCNWKSRAALWPKLYVKLLLRQTTQKSVSCLLHMTWAVPTGCHLLSLRHFLTGRGQLMSSKTADLKQG